MLQEVRSNKRNKQAKSKQNPDALKGDGVGIWGVSCCCLVSKSYLTLCDP